MDTRTNNVASQLRIIMEKDSSVLKEIGPVATESLVFEGGGIRGLGYLGATKALFEAGIMQNIKRVAGTSAGAVTAAVVALGYPQAEIERVLKNSDLEELMETKSLFNRAKIAKLIRYGYFNEGDKFLENCRKISKDRVVELITTYQCDHADDPVKLEELNNLHINPDRVTFQDLRDLSRLIPEAGIKDLYIIAAKLPAHRNANCEVEIFSAEHTPNVEAALALRASVSIPKLFKPVELNGNKYVDGGCVNNYPVDIFNGDAYKPENTYMFQGSNNQNFATLGIKIDTAREVRELLHAPIKDKPLKHQLRDKMVDRFTGIPVSHSYHLIQNKARNHYSHRSCQLYDEGIKTQQFDLSLEGKEQLIKRGYDDMKTWIENYYECAIEVRKFSSFEVMCEMMAVDELIGLCEELQNRPQEVMFVGGSCDAALAADEVSKLCESAKRILKGKVAACEIIQDSLPALNLVLRKYDLDLVGIYSRLDVVREISDVKMWVLAAEVAVGVIWGSDMNNFVKNDDVMRVRKFIDDVKGCGVMTRSQKIRLFDASKKIENFYLPDKNNKLGL